MTARDYRAMGRAGGRATVLKYGNGHMSTIGRSGYRTTLYRYFSGDRRLMSYWLSVHAGSITMASAMVGTAIQLVLPLYSYRVPPMHPRPVDRDILMVRLARILDLPRITPGQWFTGERIMQQLRDLPLCGR